MFVQSIFITFRLKSGSKTAKKAAFCFNEGKTFESSFTRWHHFVVSSGWKWSWHTCSTQYSPEECHKFANWCSCFNNNVSNPMQWPRLTSSPSLRPVSSLVDIPQTPVMHGQCDARPTVTFPAAQHCHCSWLISHPTEGRRVSWLEWLVTYQQSIPASGHPSQYKWPKTLPLCQTTKHWTGVAYNSHNFSDTHCPTV